MFKLLNLQRELKKIDFIRSDTVFIDPNLFLVRTGSYSYQIRIRVLILGCRIWSISIRIQRSASQIYWIYCLSPNQCPTTHQSLVLIIRLILGPICNSVSKVDKTIDVPVCILLDCPARGKIGENLGKYSIKKDICILFSFYKI